MVARNQSPRRKAAGKPKPQRRPTDTIALFTEKMRAMHERDLALQEVPTLRDAGQIRKAKARLALAERLHARIEAIDRQFTSQRSSDD